MSQEGDTQAGLQTGSFPLLSSKALAGHSLSSLQDEGVLWETHIWVKPKCFIVMKKRPLRHSDMMDWIQQGDHGLR